MRNRVWTTQPPAGTPIDWDSPLSQGLVDVIEFYGTPRSKLLRTTATLFGSSQKFGVPHAGNVSFDTSASYAGVTFIRADQAYVPATQTHIAVAQFNSYSGNYAGVFGTADEGGANNSFALQWQSANSYYCYGTNEAGELLTVPIPMNAPTVVGLSGSPTQTAEIYVDGVSQGTWSQNYPKSALSGGRLTLFGARDASASYATEGFYALHLFYSTYLRQPAHAQVARNPWQIYHKRRRAYSLITGSTISASISEAVTSADAYAISATATATITTAATSADAYALAATVPSAISEAATSADAYATSATIFATLTETIAPSDAYAIAVTVAAALDSAAAASSALTAVVTIAATIAEVSTAQDALGVTATILAAIAEAATATDTQATGSVTSAAYADSATAAAIFNATVSIAATLTEAGLAADQIAAMATVAADLAESGAASDAYLRSVLLAVELLENAAAADELSATAFEQIIDAAKTIITIVQARDTVNIVQAQDTLRILQ